MSSILDALKKAERESTPNRGMDTLRFPLSAQSPNRQRFRWWWVLPGIVVVFGVYGLVVWQARRPETTGPAAPVGAAPTAVKTGDSVPPLSAAAPQQEAQHTPPSAVAPPPPPAVNPSVQPDTQPPPAVASTPTPMAPPTPLAPVQPQRETAAPLPDPVVVPVAPKRPSEETAATTDQPVEALAGSDKTFRSDPRVDLQALVWAPEAATRFVVINDRLIKEGGSVGSIFVVKINPDDVLLAEGSDRWYVAFTVR